jgi:hypothetical protein
METEIVEYRNKIMHNTSIDDLPDILDELIKDYIPKKDHGMNYYFSKGLELLNVDDKEPGFDYDTFSKKYYKKLHKVVTLQHKFAKEGLLINNQEDESSDTHTQFSIKFARLFEVLHYWEQMVRSTWRVKVASDPMYDSTMNTDVGLFRFKMIDPNDNTPYQNLILYFLRVLAEKGYRRQGDSEKRDANCMERIYTEEGYDTHAWKPTMTISEFVYKAANKDDNYQQWHNLTSSATNANKAIEYLVNVNDLHFIDVVKDRKLFAFPNGIYESSIYNDETDTYEDKWYSFESGDSSKVDPARSACKYFDIPFDDYAEKSDWRDIDTPFFDSILNYQDFPKEVCDWFYVFFIGRMLYDVGQRDTWQVIPFAKGKAKSGKSTVLNGVTKKLYHTLDVGVLSNNIEKKFGLSAFQDKFLFIAPEIKGDLGLEQTDFQVMISGEDTSVPVKFKTAISKRWTTPGALAGNEPPNYKDSQGQISRRIVLWEFINTVKNGDPQLEKKLSYELPALLVKGNRAYLEAVNKFGKKDIWKVLPEYFQQTKRNMSEQTNSLQHFLGSEKIVTGKDKSGNDRYVLQVHFTRAFNNHCMENNLEKARWNKDYYSTPFDAEGFEVIRKMKRLDPVTGKEKEGTWIKGVDLVRDDEEDDLE